VVAIWVLGVPERGLLSKPNWKVICAMKAVEVKEKYRERGIWSDKIGRD
jgi:hypothetical protein